MPLNRRRASAPIRRSRRLTRHGLIGFRERAQTVPGGGSEGLVWGKRKLGPPPVPLRRCFQSLSRTFFSPFGVFDRNQPASRAFGVLEDRVRPELRGSPRWHRNSWRWDAFPLGALRCRVAIRTPPVLSRLPWLNSSGFSITCRLINTIRPLGDFGDFHANP